MVQAPMAGGRPCVLAGMLGAMALPALAWPVSCAAAQAPLYEVGFGVGAVAFEDYRGSATTHAKACAARCSTRIGSN